VIQRRFYDLTAFIATPFSDAGKNHAVAETPDKKAWLTLSGYQSLSEIEPNRTAAGGGRWTGGKLEAGWLECTLKVRVLGRLPAICRCAALSIA
jgi:hypothetical protein